MFLKNTPFFINGQYLDQDFDQVFPLPEILEIRKITIVEMEYGVSKSEKKINNQQALMDFVSNFEIPFELKK
jgi:predicted nucleic acid-binding protein